MDVLDGLPIKDDTMLEYYRQMNKNNQQEKKIQNDKIEEEKKIKEEEDYNNEIEEKYDKVGGEGENMEDADLQNIIKQKKRQSTITYSQRMLKKADNLTKFNRKNHSEGNKHISNNDL